MARRPKQPMSDDERRELEERDLMGAYRRNDYLAWIGRAKRIETRGKRIEQMLSELDQGGVYMDSAHRPSRKG